MPEDDKSLEKLVLTRTLRLNATLLGLVIGILAGLGLFLLTNFLVLKGGYVVGPHLSLLNQFFIGYEVTFLGSFVGFAYAFVVGFGLGYFFAILYNWIVTLREGPPVGRS